MLTQVKNKPLAVAIESPYPTLTRIIIDGAVAGTVERFPSWCANSPIDSDDHGLGSGYVWSASTIGGDFSTQEAAIAATIARYLVEPPTQLPEYM